MGEKIVTEVNASVYVSRVVSVQHCTIRCVHGDTGCVHACSAHACVRAYLHKSHVFTVTANTECAQFTQFFSSTTRKSPWAGFCDHFPSTAIKREPKCSRILLV